jgi:hypothetical protein
MLVKKKERPIKYPFSLFSLLTKPLNQKPWEGSSVFPSLFSSFFPSSPPFISHASAFDDALILLELAPAFILLKLAPAFIMLELASTLSFIICLSTQISWISFTIYSATHRVHGQILCSFKVEVVKLRSTILHQIKAYTLLPIETAVVLQSRRHHPFRHRTTPHFSVACTCQEQFHVCRGVLALFSLSASVIGGFWSTLMFPAMERPSCVGAWTTCAITVGSHPWRSTVLWFFLLFVLFFY